MGMGWITPVLAMLLVCGLMDFMADGKTRTAAEQV